MGKLYKVYSNGSTILNEVLNGIKEKETSDIRDATKTYIPLNSELIKVVSDNELLESPSMSWAFGKSLHEYFSDVFPNDPARGYFSLIGLNAFKGKDVSQ